MGPSVSIPDPGMTMTARELVAAADGAGFTHPAEIDLQATFLDMLGGYSVADLLRARIHVSREARGDLPPPWEWDRRPHDRERL